MALALAVAVGALAAPLAAHDFWIVPSSLRPAPGAALAVRLKVGEHLQGDPLPRDPALVERFALSGPVGPAGPAGEIAVAGPAGAEPAGFTRLGGPGLYWIVYDSAPARLDLPAAKFEAALRQEGLERMAELRRARGESSRPSRERFSRCAKALVRVGGGDAGGAAGKAAAGLDRPLGLELEIVPERDPGTLRPGEELPVRLLFRGKPLAGALVAALHSQHADGRLAARTDAAGRARLALPAAGFWLVKAVHMVPAPAGSGIDWESSWASLTFETSGL